MLVHRVVACAGGFSQAPSQLRIQPGDVGGLCKGIRWPDPIGEEELQHRAENLVLLFGSSDGLQWDLASFEKLDQANTLDVFSRKQILSLGANECKRSQPMQVLDGLSGGQS